MQNVLKVLILLTLLINSLSLDAQLKLIDQHPATFNLTFDQNITLPNFQILLNNNNLSYNVITQQQPSSYYLFQITTDTQSLVSNLEIYTLRFNQPLDMKGSSNLNLDKFILRPTKPDPQPINVMWLSILLVTFAYGASLIDIMGLWIIDFIQIYSLIMETSVFVTYFQSQIAKYFLMVFPLLHARGQHPTSNDLVTSMWIPIFIIMVSFLIAIIFRFCLKKPEKFITKKMKQFFVYRFLITMCYIFSLNLIVNSVGFIKHAYLFQGTLFIQGTIFCYIGYYLLLAIFYTGIITLNPRLKQKKEQFKQYQKTQHYNMFNKLYNGLCVQKWVKRNFHIFILVKKIIIGIICGFFHDFFYVALSFQIAHLFYIFTIRPYKYNFFNTFGVIVQSLITIFYFYMFQTTLYFQMSPQILTHKDILNYQLVRVILFGGIYLVMVGGNFYQIYERIIQFKTQWNNYKSDLQEKQKKQENRSKKDSGYSQLGQISNRKQSKNLKYDQFFDSKIKTPRIWQQKSLLQNVSQKKE